MPTLEELVQTQERNAEEINRFLSNIKKTPKERRSLEYYQRKSKELDELWKNFEKIDNCIRRDSAAKEDHPYFVQRVHEIMSQRYREADDDIQKNVQGIKQEYAKTQASGSESEVKTTHNLIKMRDATISKIMGTLDDILTSGIHYSRQQLDVMQREVEYNMKTMQQLQDKLCSENVSHDIHAFLTQQTEITNKIMQIEDLKATLNPEPINQTALQQENHTQYLPKVTIPKFNGDYMSWQPFYDMFNEMIHKKAMPAIQKMWFLKTNISGEAARLIQNLSLTETNYETAWKTLQDRFNNPRILTNNIINRLLNQPKISENPSSAAIKGLHDTTRECCAALNNLKIDTSTWDPILVNILLKKLDHGTHILYEQSVQLPRSLPSLEELLGFLETRFQSLEAVGRTQTTPKRTSSAATTSQENNHCKLCNNGIHQLYYCNLFLSWSAPERLKWIQQQKLCANCFKGDHRSRQCTSSSCRKCKKKHNSLVHLDNYPQNTKTLNSTNNSSTDANSPTGSNTQTSTVASANHSGARKGYVLLATARVKITGSNGRSGVFKAILDSGSQINIVTNRLLNRLSLKPSQTSLCIEGIGNQPRNTNQRINLDLQSTTSNFSTRLEAFVLPNIIPAQPSTEFNYSSWPIPDNIQLADPEFSTTANIDVLLGAEYYLELLTTGKIQLSPELPILRNTKLGWIVSGKIRNNTNNSAICAVYGASEANTDELIQRFWRLDEFDTDNTFSTQEKLCEQQFIQTTTRNNEGRFVVRLCLSENPSCLGDTKRLAFSRLLALERRLAMNPDLKKQYVDFMKEYEELGHMTRINNSEVMDPHYYIPHHCVIKPESKTTKLRVVFDASAKSSSGISLNDILCIGPPTQGDLFGMLLRFRTPTFVFCTDIEKMYRQILIDPEDRNMQLIYWRNNSNEAVGTYQLNTVTYGTSAAPYLATKCLQYLADRNMGKYPLGATALKHDFYVDDGMSGSNSLLTAIEMQRQLTSLLQEAGFKLRKWCANHSKLLSGIPPEDVELNLDFDNQSTKILGLTWNPKADVFCLRADIQETDKITKRTVTSDLARIFDPLGIAGPVVVSAKIFIQQLWQLQLSWDEPLPANLNNQWATFRQHLKHLNNLNTKRHVFDGEIPSDVQIHTFVDASEKAYGATVYIRSKLRDGRLIVRLLCAKSRIAPIKKVTLPRLELCAALLGAQLTTRVKRELRAENTPTYLWSDSEIVLHWINSAASSLRTFVANRVSKIQEQTIGIQWRHVSSKQNPADLISRGVNPEKLSQCSLWFFGPMFLHGNVNQWPKEFNKNQTPSPSEEFKQISVSALSTTSASLEDIIYKIENRNSFKTLLRIVAYIQRFIHNSKIPKNERPASNTLSPPELNSAKLLIVKAMQFSEFKNEISTLKRRDELDRTSSICGLSPFLDENDILRVGGRLNAASISYNAKHPILLPYNDPISKLIMRMLHNDNHHCGPQTLLSISRQQFWVIKGKSMARHIVQSCVRCTRARPKLMQQIMGDLPACRVTPTRPFIISGVDYCGPLWVHYKLRGKRPHKVYIAVFICFSTKAVHLEVVSDLTTEAFIGALKRFIARRGRCQTIYSDNATNFIGAQNQLDELKTAIFTKHAQEAITRSCSKDGIEFKFIPPRAPHFGGLWEAAVKSAKQLLLRSVSTASLTHEELETIIIEIEAILNSRPLTPLSSDPNDLTALTPGHFLIGEPLTAQVDSEAKNSTISLARRWNLVSQLKHEFWNRWSVEYLHHLQEKQKWKTSSENAKEGRLVIIKEDNLPVMQWPLGRILKTYEGTDGKVRVADVKTASGIKRRPIHRLAPLIKEEELQPSKDSKPTHSVQAEETDIPPFKKPRPVSSSILLTLITTLLLLPVVMSRNVKIKNFHSDPGLYFEGIGSVKLITAEWRLMIYYDLSPFISELKAFQSGTTTLQQLCSPIIHNSTCNILTTNLNQLRKELIEEKELFSSSRVKRGAFNIVGNVARSLFGVLDSDYANEMSNTIRQAKDETDYLFQLLKNQTSIIDSTINIIKQDELNSQGQLMEIVNKVNEQENAIAKQSDQISRTQSISLLANQLTLTAINLQRIEREIIDVLTDTHHGKISPLLLSPTQLKHELSIIRAHLPTRRTLPIEDDGLIQLYKLMKAKGAVTRSEVIFEVILPLVDHQFLELFNIIPVPTIKNNTLISINGEESILAINHHRDEYIPFTTHEISNCIMTKSDVFICNNKQFKLRKNEENDSCEFNIFNNRQTTKCKLIQLTGNSTWTQLKDPNKWIFATTSKLEMSAVCGANSTQYTLTGTGIMELEPSCTFKGTFITIQGHFGLSNTLHTSYTQLMPIDYISEPQEITKIFNTTNNQLETHLNQLNLLSRQLNESTVIRIPELIKSNSLHHHTVSYSALVISILLLITILGFKLYSKQHKNTNYKCNNPIPQPAPRAGTFTIDIVDT